jgi:hypothetical protein
LHISVDTGIENTNRIEAKECSSSIFIELRKVIEIIIESMRWRIRNKSREPLHSNGQINVLRIYNYISLSLFMVEEVLSFFWVEYFFLHIIDTVLTSNKFLMETKSLKRIYLGSNSIADSFMKQVNICIAS